MEKWIVLPDMQVPYEDKETLRAVEQYMSDHRWDGCINLGDFLDFAELSKFDEDAPGRKIDRTSDTFERGREILDRQLAILRKRNKNCRYVLLEGNHDYRAVVYMEKHEELEGTLNVPKNLELAKRRIEWIPSWSKGKVFKLGNAFFVHGRYTNKYHAAKMVDVYGVSIYYGHTHDVQEFPKVLQGNDKTIVGKSLGCLCRYDQSYLRGNPTNWQQSFSVFYIFPDGFYTEQTIRIFKHRFVSPDGKVYDGRR